MLTDYVNPAIDRSYEKFSARAHSFVVKMAAELDKLSRQGWDVFLIPLSTGGYGNDIRINLDIAAYMRETPIVILDTLSPQQCLDLVFQMDLNICMKFHAHLFSMIAGVPFVSIDFTRKVDLFLEAHDLRKTICAKFQENEFDTSRFAETVDTTLAEDKMFREQFVETSENYYRRLHEITGTIRRDWLGESS
jgi:polysaccharide pyruvyl transferase WcaK-like protein